MKVSYTKERALSRIVRPVYDQEEPIVCQGQSVNPFGLPSNLEEQREAWRKLVPFWKNDKAANELFFKLSNISDAALKKLRHLPVNLKDFERRRDVTVLAAKCLALILITEKGKGDTPGLKQGELAYNWDLCHTVFPPTSPSSTVISSCGCNLIQTTTTTGGRKYTHLEPLLTWHRLEQVSIPAMMKWVAEQGPCPVGRKTVSIKATSVVPGS